MAEKDVESCQSSHEGDVVDGLWALITHWSILFFFACWYSFHFLPYFSRPEIEQFLNSPKVKMSFVFEW